MTADTQQVLASGAAAMPPTANAVVTGAHSWSPFGGSHPITGGGPSNGAFPTIVTGSMPGRGGPTAAEASTQGSGRTITTIRAPPNQLPSKQTVGGSATGTPTAALPQGKSDLVSLALFTSLQGSNGPDADVVAQVLQSIDNASGGSGADTCFPGGEKSIAEGEAYALRGQRKAAAGVKELLGAEAKGQEDDGDAGEDGTDDGSDDGSDEAGAKGAGARRKSNPVGRPVAYTGDPGAVELSEADRRRLKRRIANRESARRVRQKRQELMEELQLKCTALTQQNARLLAHLSTYDQQRQALANQVNLLRERYALKTSENSGLMMEVASLRKALKDNGVSVEENLATVNGSMPSSGAMPTLPMRPGGQDQHTMQQQLSAALTMPGSSLISSAFASMLPNAGQLSTLGNGQSSGMSSAAAAAAAAMAATSTLPQIAVQPAQQVVSMTTS